VISATKAPRHQENQFSLDEKGFLGA